MPRKDEQLAKREVEENVDSHLITYVKRLASESIKNGYFHWNGSAVLFGWPSSEFRLQHGCEQF